MERVTVDEVMQSDWPFAIAARQYNYDGSCACCRIQGEGFDVYVHCWRTYYNDCDCDYSGIHVTGTIPAETQQRLAEHIRDNNGWTGVTDFKITVKETT